MSTNYYAPREPFIRCEKRWGTAYRFTTDEGGIVDVDGSNEEVMRAVLMLLFRTDDDDAHCAARMTGLGLELRNRWWPDDYLLLSEYGELVSVGELRSPTIEEKKEPPK